jgi:hypothetical protein
MREVTAKSTRHEHCNDFSNSNEWSVSALRVIKLLLCPITAERCGLEHSLRVNEAKRNLVV